MIDVFLWGAIFVSLVAGQFARIELIGGLATVYVHEFILVVYVLFGIYRFGLGSVYELFKNNAVKLMCGILILSYCVSFFEFNALQNGIALLYLFRIVLHVLFGVYLMKVANMKQWVRNSLSNLLFTFSILLLIISAVQYVFFPNFWSITTFGWDPHLYRASAIYLDVYVAAAVYGLLALYWYIKGRFAVSVSFVLVLLLSLSRSGYISFLLSIIYLLIIQNRRKLLAVALGVFILLVVVMPKPFGEGGNLLRTASIQSRALDYERGISLFLKKPIIGFGYNRIRFAKEAYGMATMDDRSHSLSAFHSSFLVVLVSMGMAGFISFLFLLSTIIRKYSFMRVFILFLSAMSVFDNVLFHILIIMPFLFIFAELRYSSLE